MRRRFLILGCALALYLIDRSVKSWPFDTAHFVVTQWNQGSHGFFISLGRLENSGGVFSTPIPPVVLLVGAGLALTFLVGLAGWAWRRERLFTLAGASLMVVGGFSNMLDRIIGAGVVDVFQLAGGLSFNLADLYLLAGLVALVL